MVTHALTKRKATEAGIVNNHLGRKRTARAGPPQNDYDKELEMLKSHPTDDAMLLQYAEKYGIHAGNQYNFINKLTATGDTRSLALANYLTEHVDAAQQRMDQKKKKPMDEKKLMDKLNGMARAGSVAKQTDLASQWEAAGGKTWAETKAAEKKEGEKATQQKFEDLMATTGQEVKSWADTAQPRKRPTPKIIATPITNPSGGVSPHKNDELEWWARLPGYGVDWPVGAGLLGTGVGCVMINNMLYLRSSVLGMMGLAGITSGGYLLTAKGLHWYKTGTVANAGDAVQDGVDSALSIIPGYEKAKPSKSGECPPMVHAWLGPIPVFGAWSVGRNLVCRTTGYGKS